ncbi:MAG: hypothetical protein IT548_05300 [Alphaproteobacteria bacterium]|nr:hypothetical protein [Alphaproteobacteria bacterium]
MTMDELHARLSTIERLLIVLISSPAYAAALDAMDGQLYADVGQRLNRLFPSDPEYAPLQLELDGFRDAVTTARSIGS